MSPRVCLATAVLVAHVASDAPAQTTFPASSPGVQVQVVVDSTGRAQVVERYRVPRESGVLQLQFLQRACASVSGVTVSNYVDTLTLASTLHEPWVTLRDTTIGGRAYNADSSGFDISYTVSLGAPSADIPLVQLTRPVPRREEEREGGVSLSVATEGAVGFPRLSRPAPGDPWVGRFVAIPSFVRVAWRSAAATPAADCAAFAPGESSDGGLRWRFWTFLCIMAAWVPLYLAWARRAQEGDA